jgi:hypothetical protein
MIRAADADKELEDIESEDEDVQLMEDDRKKLSWPFTVLSMTARMSIS